MICFFPQKLLYRKTNCPNEPDESVTKTGKKKGDVIHPHPTITTKITFGKVMINELVAAYIPVTNRIQQNKGST
jgi:hypothetical protein